ncbi:MAG TPA: peptide ABC transporter substrate-binding protein [Acetobacteraceae bacterium]|nr:peptide ABC transporter substrate-binding protein [Acetobacteraceae bacterium]
MRSLPLALAGLALAASAANAASHDQLVVGMTAFSSSEHPYIDPLIVKSWTLGFTSRQVTYFTPDTWTNTCALCTEVPSIENGRAKVETQPNGKPGLAVKWTLKPGLKWGDGVPLTTKDIAYTAKVGADPGNGFPDIRVWGRIYKADVLDDQNIVLHLDEVTPLYNRMGKLLSEHSDGPAYANAKAPGDYVKQNVYNRAPTTPGLWNGPYLMTANDGASQIVLEPNPYWTGDKPYLKRIVIRSIADTAALQANLLSGDIDLIPGDGNGISLDQAVALQKQHPDQFHYIFNDSVTFQHLDVNLDNPFLQDPRVRRAILMAIDRQTMSDRLVGGRYKLAATWVPPKEPMFAPGIPIVPYDPEGARALLKDAGWTPGADGILRNAKGEKFTIEYGTPVESKLGLLIQQVVQDQLKKVGIETVLKNEIQRSFFGETMKKRKFGGLAQYTWLFNVSYPPIQLYAIGNVPTEANGWGGSNYMDWKNQDFERALQASTTDLDVEQQHEDWAEMQKIYAQDLPTLPLFFVPQAHIIPLWLKGYVTAGMTDYPTLRGEEWHAE